MSSDRRCSTIAGTSPERKSVKHRINVAIAGKRDEPIGIDEVAESSLVQIPDQLDAEAACPAHEHGERGIDTASFVQEDQRQRKCSGQRRAFCLHDAIDQARQASRKEKKGGRSSASMVFVESTHRGEKDREGQERQKIAVIMRAVYGHGWHARDQNKRRA